MDIIIPTCRTRKEVESLVKEIERLSTAQHNIVVTGYKASAATNRNYGLHNTSGDIVCMLDDDMRGFYLGWDDDLEYAFKDKDVSIVTARLLNPDGSKGIMMGWQDRYPIEPNYIEIPEKYIPTACIAFRRTGIFFDENFIGSGFEDTDFCDMMPGKRILANKCKLVHINETKNQNGEYWKVNESYYKSKRERSCR